MRMTLRSLGVALLLVVAPRVLLASSAAGARAGTKPRPTIAVVPSACGAMNGFQPLPGKRTMLVTAAATSRPRAAVIMLHGYTATPAGEEAVSGWTQFMAKTNVLVAYPQGTPTPYGGYGWSTGAARFATTGTNDVLDIRNVIVTIQVPHTAFATVATLL